MTAETLKRRVAALGAMDYLARNFNDERLGELRDAMRELGMEVSLDGC